MKTLTLLLGSLLLLVSVSSKLQMTGAEIKNRLPLKQTLNTAEEKSLKRMREEEKLAHDVYIALYNKWGVPIFKNISSSEQTHTNAVLSLLNSYNITDPVGNNSDGTFTDVELQKLYNTLIEEGNTSLLNAFIVGATIEDLDIFDLQNWSSKVTKEDIKSVYHKLINGSKNHMRSFCKQIQRKGGVYEAKYISKEELDELLN